MDEEVQIMGDSQDEIPRKVYEVLVAEWAAEIDHRNAKGLVESDPKEVINKVEGLGLLDSEQEDNLIAAVKAFQKALKGEGIARGLLPEGVSQLHISARPEETKSTVQEMAQKALTKIKSKSSEGRSR